jgi:NAD-dependent DNA ligase
MTTKALLARLRSVKFDRLHDELMATPVETLIELKKNVDSYYANNTGDADLSDERYDVLLNILEELGEKTSTLVPVADESKKVKLPYWMGSMDKKKTLEGVEKWVKTYKGPYVMTPKLDGVSCLVVYKKGQKKLCLYTRGDGKTGSDVSPLQAFIKGLPAAVGASFVVRGELIISKSAFEAFKDDFKNARQLVSGTVNSKHIRENVASCIQFIGYEVINDDVNDGVMKLSDQLEYLQKLGSNSVASETTGEVTMDVLTKTLVDWKRNLDYEIDGIVITSNHIYERNTSGNPDYAFAFKMNMEENTVRTGVIDIVWNVSKRGMVKPTVRLEPVELSGVTIQNATGFNANFIYENKIGKGAIVSIIRSGDVIPHILEVIRPGIVNDPDMECEWNDTHVDLIVTDTENEEMALATLVYFFKKIGVKSVSTQTIAHLHENGLTTIQAILSAKATDYNMGEVISKKIHTNMKEAMASVSLSCLVAASGLLGGGIGERKIDALLEVIPNLFEETFKGGVDKITEVDGFSDKTATLVVENLPNVRAFLKSLLKEEKKKDVVKETAKEVTKLGLKVVFSGFRDKDMETMLKQKGVDIMSSVSKNTNYVIIKDESDDETSAKIDKARELGINVVSRSAFLKLI